MGVEVGCGGGLSPPSSLDAQSAGTSISLSSLQASSSPAHITSAIEDGHVAIALSLDSLTVASGVSRSDRYGNRVAAREQALRDSLAAGGYSGDEQQEEMDWIIRIENGEATPAERRRKEEDAIVRSLEEYGGTVRHDDESEFFE